jgi:hypothetical protein
MASSYEISPRRDSGNEQLIEGDGERAGDYDYEDPQDPNAFSYEPENTEGYDDVVPSSPSVSEQRVNMSEVQGNVGTALRNAFDMSKMVSAFDNIFTVFNDQQSSMSQMTHKFSTLKSEAAQKFQSVDDSIGMLKRSDQTNSETIRSLRHALQAKMESEQLLTGRSKSLASYAFADKMLWLDQLVMMQEELQRTQQRLGRMEDRMFDLTTRQELMQSQVDQGIAAVPTNFNSRPLTGTSVDLFTASGASPKLMDFRQSVSSGGGGAPSHSGKVSPALVLSRKNSARPHTPQSQTQLVAQPIENNRRSFRQQSPQPDGTKESGADDAIRSSTGTRSHTPLTDTHLSDIVFATQVALMAATGNESITEENEDDMSVSNSVAGVHSGNVEANVSVEATAETPMAVQLNVDSSTAEIEMVSPLGSISAFDSAEILVDDQAAVNPGSQPSSRRHTPLTEEDNPVTSVSTKADAQLTAAEIMAAVAASEGASSFRDFSPVPICPDSAPSAQASRQPSRMATPQTQPVALSKSPALADEDAFLKSITPVPSGSNLVPDVLDGSEQLTTSSKPPLHNNAATGSRSSTPSASGGATTTLKRKNKSSPFAHLSPDQRYRISEELKIRGEFIVAAKQFKDEGELISCTGLRTRLRCFACCLSLML